MRLSLALALLASPAMADDYLAIRSPSGNIFCGLSSGDYAGVRCDMIALTPTNTTPPPDCELDWGSSFEVGPNDRKGALACVGDSVADANALVLDYGKSVSLGTITCTSEKTGMTCVNGLGHGFSLSKAKQRLF